jgi:hypothetical protein
MRSNVRHRVSYYELLTIPTTASATTLALHVISISYALRQLSILSVVPQKGFGSDERTEGSAALGLGAWVSGELEVTG